MVDQRARITEREMAIDPNSSRGAWFRAQERMGLDPLREHAESMKGFSWKKKRDHGEYHMGPKAQAYMLDEDLGIIALISYKKRGLSRRFGRAFHRLFVDLRPPFSGEAVLRVEVGDDQPKRAITGSIAYSDADGNITTEPAEYRAPIGVIEVVNEDSLDIRAFGHPAQPNDIRGIVPQFNEFMKAQGAPDAAEEDYYFFRSSPVFRPWRADE